MTSSVVLRHRPSPRQPRPASIAVTGVTHDTKKLETSKPPLPKTRASSKDKLKRKSITSPTESVGKSIVSPTVDIPIEIPTSRKDETEIVKQDTPAASETKEEVASVV